MVSDGDTMRPAVAPWLEDSGPHASKESSSVGSRGFKDECSSLKGLESFKV